VSGRQADRLQLKVASSLHRKHADETPSKIRVLTEEFAVPRIANERSFIVHRNDRAIIAEAQRARQACQLVADRIGNLVTRRLGI
jgi:hypothetical protein